MKTRKTAPNMLAHVGGRIWNEREAQGLTQHQLSHIAGISQSHLARLEYGDHERVPLVTLARIAKALGLSLGELIQEAEQVTSIDETGGPATMPELRDAVNSLVAEERKP